MDITRDQSTLRSDAKGYAKRLHEYSTKFALSNELKLGHCQEAVARYLFDFPSWNHLCAADDFTYAPPNIEQLCAFAMSLWVDGRFDILGYPEKWFDKQDWFGEEVPICSRQFGYNSVLAGAAYALREDTAPIPSGISLVKAWATWHHDNVESDAAYKMTYYDDLPLEHRYKKVGTGHWNHLWMAHFVYARLEEGENNSIRDITIWTHNVLQDKELTSLIAKAAQKASRSNWSYSACAFLGLFDNARSLKKHIEEEGVEQAKWALKRMIELEGEATAPHELPLSLNDKDVVNELVSSIKNSPGLTDMIDDLLASRKQD